MTTPGKPQHMTLLRSFRCALGGYPQAFATERNIRIQAAFGVLAVLLALLLRVDAVGWAVIVLSTGSVISAELMNTAVESIVDLITEEHHPLAGKAKDVAAAAVLTVSITAAIAGIIVYIRALSALIG